MEQPPNSKLVIYQVGEKFYIRGESHESEREISRYEYIKIRDFEDELFKKRVKEHKENKGI